MKFWTNAFLVSDFFLKYKWMLQMSLRAPVHVVSFHGMGSNNEVPLMIGGATTSKRHTASSLGLLDCFNGKHAGRISSFCLEICFLFRSFIHSYRSSLVFITCSLLFIVSERFPMAPDLTPEMIMISIQFCQHVEAISFWMRQEISMISWYQCLIPSSNRFKSSNIFQQDTLLETK